MNDTDLVTIPRTWGLVKVRRSDLRRGKAGDLIPMFDTNGNRLKRHEAWAGNGKPSDITRGEARRARKAELNRA